MSELTSANLSTSDLAYESALRPKALDEFIGQAKVREQMSLVLRAAQMQWNSAAAAPKKKGWV